MTETEAFLSEAILKTIILTTSGLTIAYFLYRASAWIKRKRIQKMKRQIPIGRGYYQCRR